MANSAAQLKIPWFAENCGSSLFIVEFNIPLNTLEVILETIFLANHLTGAKTWSLQLISCCLVSELNLTEHCEP